MPFQPINFAAIPPIGRPALADAFATFMKGYKDAGIPAEMRSRAQAEQIANAMAQQKLTEEPQRFDSDMANALANRNEAIANTNRTNTMTPLDAIAASLKNKFYPQVTQSEVNANNALAANRQLSGGGVGVGGKEENLFQSLIAKDNPGLSPSQVYAASNAVRQGIFELPDGTKINPLSPAAQSSLDRLAKYGSTAAIITGNMRGKQAETEIDVLNRYANAGTQPYANTIFGYSPAQIADSLKNDDAAQIRQGRFIAGQALNYEIAQNRIKLANGQPGVNSTQELIDLSQQNIKSKFPKLSAKARQEASDYLNKALKEANEARQSIGIGASSAYTINPKGQQNLLNTGNARPATNQDITTVSTDKLMALYHLGGAK